MSIKQKVKYAFSRLKYYQEKYGVVTGIIVVAFAVASIIVSSLISNIMTSMKTGLIKVGNGLILGSLLPGMIGAIVSILFKTVGDVFGFISKNIYLLILLIVTFIMNNLKIKKSDDKLIERWLNNIKGKHIFYLNPSILNPQFIQGHFFIILFVIFLFYFNTRLALASVLVPIKLLQTKY